jgi:hypothetical protein
VHNWTEVERNCPNPLLNDRAMFDAATVFNDGWRRSYDTPTCMVEWQKQG